MDNPPSSSWPVAMPLLRQGRRLRHGLRKFAHSRTRSIRQMSLSRSEPGERGHAGPNRPRANLDIEETKPPRPLRAAESVAAGEGTARDIRNLASSGIDADLARRISMEFAIMATSRMASSWPRRVTGTMRRARSIPRRCRPRRRQDRRLDAGGECSSSGTLPSANGVWDQWVHPHAQPAGDRAASSRPAPRGVAPASACAYRLSLSTVSIMAFARASPSWIGSGR